MRTISYPALLVGLLSTVNFSSVMSRDMPLDLGLAQPYAILAGSTVTSSGTVGTVVTGDIGIFPLSEITGFPPAVINGAVNSANGASGGAQGALTTAYNAAAAKPFNYTLSDSDLGGMILFPGVYKFDDTAAMNGMLTLDADGDAAAVWTFQVGSSLLIAESSSIIFKDNIGNPDYVYWQVGTSVTLAIGVPMIGNIMALASITVNDGATVKGRCLARNAAVTLDRSVVTIPTTVSFSAAQAISGISLEQYNTNPALDSSTLKEAIAQTMTGVLPFNIQNFEVTAGSIPNSIVLNYDVVVSSTMTTEELQKQLNDAQSDGTFDSYLHDAAQANGATDLLSAATFGAPTMQPSSQPSSQPSGQPNQHPTSRPSTQPSAQPINTVPVVPFVDVPLDFGLAQPFVILAGSTVTSTGVVGTVVSGNIGIFPGSAITGFPPAILHGSIDAGNGDSGGAQAALTVAYNVLVAKQFTAALSNVDLGGMTLLPGVYKFDAAATMNGILTLDANGDSSAIWTFQIGSSLLIAEGSSIIFKNSVGNPDYVYWQVGSSATLAIGVPMIGNILALASITVNAGASVNGRCLARNAAVSLDNNVITMPTVVSFHATQTVTVISLTQYNINPDLNAATLKEAIADSMTGVLPSNILNLEVTAGPTTAATILRRSLSTSSIILNYDVVVSSTMTSEQLQAQLTAAVETGVFNDNLHAAAVRNGASDLDNATSNTITTEPISTDDGNDTPVVTGSSSSAGKPTLSGGAIAGIVVGCITLLVLAMVLYRFVGRSVATDQHHCTNVSVNEV